VRSEKLAELTSYIEEFKSIRQEDVEIGKQAFLSTCAFQCQLNNGKLVVREKLIKGKKDGSAAIVLPMTIDKNVIMIVEPRVFTRETVGVGFPAGYIEIDEDPAVAALRELREEIGCVPKELIHLDSYYQDEGCSAAFNHIYLGRGCEYKYKQQLDGDEHIRCFECTFVEALELEEMGIINSASAKLALQKAKKYI
jgi:ADP-ribose pyrophosphatase